MLNYKVQDGIIELDENALTVANWTNSGECRWLKHFGTIEESRKEFERFRFLEIKNAT